MKATHEGMMKLARHELCRKCGFGPMGACTLQCSRKEIVEYMEAMAKERRGFGDRVWYEVMPKFRMALGVRWEHDMMDVMDEVLREVEDGE